ncbi:hypothetical protein NIES4074_64900 (plasmid) [Cylindrospermum sp. NIES-4074]|nr:hypothetical protein NIES4074_64900 [Cylindrospermum sp. NIES-4074]
MLQYGARVLDPPWVAQQVRDVLKKAHDIAVATIVRTFPCSLFPIPYSLFPVKSSL